ncbi:hypothetical protein N7523_000528 [Penicillium sp. IBT 18751x]|nr:hypothetical protein N7523_000528 [Penicillium sp. IBT 18751x]
MSLSSLMVTQYKLFSFKYQKAFQLMQMTRSGAHSCLVSYDPNFGRWMGKAHGIWYIQIVAINEGYNQTFFVAAETVRRFSNPRDQ